MDKSVQVDLSVSARNDEAPPLHLYDDVKNIAELLLERTSHRPNIGIICGSGLGALADMIEDQDIFPYKDIPGFPISTAPSHRGRLVFGRLSGRSVVCMQGRLHPFEGYPLWKCCLPIRVMAVMNVQVLVITNAVGSVNPDYQLGDVMIIKDHINMPGMAGIHPLRGPNDDRFGLRFPAMSHAYNKELREVGRQVAKEMDITSSMREGCYCMQAGPSFETIGEARAMRILGADVVGMSTVHEVVVANHSGMRVFGLSLVTNFVVTDEDDETVVDAQFVLDTAFARTKLLQEYVCRFVRSIPDKHLQ